MDGARLYLDKRLSVLATGTSLVEIDLLRGGEALPMLGPRIDSDYRILVSRGWRSKELCWRALHGRVTRLT